MPSAAAAAVRPQEELYALEEATLFNSLCLLEVQHAEGARLLDFSRAMFRKPNAKGLEFVLHFVYATVKGKIAAKKVLHACRRQGSGQQQHPLSALACAAVLLRAVLQGRVAADRQGPPAGQGLLPGWSTPARTLAANTAAAAAAAQHAC